MPFGIVNDPATFQRMMTEVLNGFVGRTCPRCIDDIITCSESFEDHLQYTPQFLDKLAHHNMTIRLRKPRFCGKQLEYLGHIVSIDGIKVVKEKVKAITEYQAPRNSKELSRFLEMSGWYQRFIHNNAKVTDH